MSPFSSSHSLLFIPIKQDYSWTWWFWIWWFCLFQPIAFSFKPELQALRFQPLAVCICLFLCTGCCAYIIVDCFESSLSYCRWKHSYGSVCGCMAWTLPYDNTRAGAGLRQEAEAIRRQWGENSCGYSGLNCFFLFFFWHGPVCWNSSLDCFCFSGRNSFRSCNWEIASVVVVSIIGLCWWNIGYNLSNSSIKKRNKKQKQKDKQSFKMWKTTRFEVIYNALWIICQVVVKLRTFQNWDVTLNGWNNLRAVKVLKGGKSWWNADYTNKNWRQRSGVCLNKSAHVGIDI